MQRRTIMSDPLIAAHADIIGITIPQIDRMISDAVPFPTEANKFASLNNPKLIAIASTMVTASKPYPINVRIQAYALWENLSPPASPDRAIGANGMHRSILNSLCITVTTSCTPHTRIVRPPISPPKKQRMPSENQSQASVSSF